MEKNETFARIVIPIETLKGRTHTKYENSTARKMEKEKENLRFSTSTPVKPLSSRKVLKEKHNSPNRQQTVNDTEKKQSKRDQVPKSRRSARFAQKPREKPVDDKEEVKRRQKAVEAMRVLEQRRRRFVQNQIYEDSIVDDLADFSMSVSPIQSTSTIPTEEDKKRIYMRELKRQRVLEFLAEQEARKNGTKPKTIPQSHDQKSQKPKVPTQSRRVKSLLPSRVDYEERQMQKPRTIKYSMDQLRSLNPYGFYFM